TCGGGDEPDSLAGLHHLLEVVGHIVRRSGTALPGDVDLVHESGEWSIVDGEHDDRRGAPARRRVTAGKTVALPRRLHQIATARATDQTVGVLLDDVGGARVQIRDLSPRQPRRRTGHRRPQLFLVRRGGGTRAGTGRAFVVLRHVSRELAHAPGEPLLVGLARLLALLRGVGGDRRRRPEQPRRPTTEYGHHHDGHGDEPTGAFTPLLLLPAVLRDRGELGGLLCRAHRAHR